MKPRSLQKGRQACSKGGSPVGILSVVRFFHYFIFKYLVEFTIKCIWPYFTCWENVSS